MDRAPDCYSGCRGFKSRVAFLSKGNQTRGAGSFPRLRASDSGAPRARGYRPATKPEPGLRRIDLRTGPAATQRIRLSGRAQAGARLMDVGRLPVTFFPSPPSSGEKVALFAPDEGQQRVQTVGSRLAAPGPVQASAPHRPRGSCRRRGRLRDAVSSPPENGGEGSNVPVTNAHNAAASTHRSSPRPWDVPPALSPDVR